MNERDPGQADENQSDHGEGNRTPPPVENPVTPDNQPDQEADVGLIINDLQSNGRQDEVLRAYRGAFGVNVLLSEDDDNCLIALCDINVGDTITVGRGTVINDRQYQTIHPIADDRMFIRIRSNADQEPQFFSTVGYGYQLVNYMNINRRNVNVDYVIQNGEANLDAIIDGEHPNVVFILIYATVGIRPGEIFFFRNHECRA